MNLSLLHNIHCLTAQLLEQSILGTKYFAAFDLNKSTSCDLLLNIIKLHGIGLPNLSLILPGESKKSIEKKNTLNEEN